MQTQYAYQFVLNGSRLGFYEPFRHTLNSLAGYGDPNTVRVWSSITAGASSGVVGGALQASRQIGSPCVSSRRD